MSQAPQTLDVSKLNRDELMKATRAKALDGGARWHSKVLKQAGVVRFEECSDDQLRAMLGAEDRQTGRDSVLKAIRAKAKDGGADWISAAMKRAGVVRLLTCSDDQLRAILSFGAAEHQTSRDELMKAIRAKALDGGARWISRATKHVGVTCLGECSDDQLRAILTY